MTPSSPTSLVHNESRLTHAVIPFEKLKTSFHVFFVEGWCKCRDIVQAMNARKKISILDLLKKCRKFAKQKNVNKGVARRAVLHACTVCL